MIFLTIVALVTVLFKSRWKIGSFKTMIGGIMGEKIISCWAQGTFKFDMASRYSKAIKLFGGYLENAEFSQSVRVELSEEQPVSRSGEISIVCFYENGLKLDELQMVVAKGLKAFGSVRVDGQPIGEEEKNRTTKKYKKQLRQQKQYERKCKKREQKKKQRTKGGVDKAITRKTKRLKKSGLTPDQISKKLREEEERKERKRLEQKGYSPTKISLKLRGMRGENCKKGKG